jgi:hypothetical protein
MPKSTPAQLARAKAWVVANRDRVRAYQRAYSHRRYHNDPAYRARRLASSRKYHRTHPLTDENRARSRAHYRAWAARRTPEQIEKIRRRRREWYQKNAPRLRAYAREYHRTHPRKRKILNNEEAHRRAYYRLHAEVLREKARLRYHADAAYHARRLAQVRAYHRQHPHQPTEATRARQRAAYARRTAEQIARTKARARAWRQANAPRLRAYAREYYRTHVRKPPPPQAREAHRSSAHYANARARRRRRAEFPATTPPDYPPCAQ